MKGIIGATAPIVALLIGLVLGAIVLLAVGLLGVQPPGLSAAAPTQPWDVSLTITDEFLTKQLNGADAGQATTGAQPQQAPPVQLKDARARFRDDGTVVITGAVAPSLPGGRGGPSRPPAGNQTPATTGGAGPDVAVEIVLRPSVSAEGAIRAEVVSARFGPLPVPAQIGRLLEDPINQQAKRAFGDGAHRVTETVVRQGVMQVRIKRATSGE